MDASDGALVLTRHSQMFDEGRSWSLSWGEGGSAVHRFVCPMKPHRLTVRMRTPEHLSSAPRDEGPSLVFFACDHDACVLATGVTAPHGAPPHRRAATLLLPRAFPDAKLAKSVSLDEGVTRGFAFYGALWAEQLFLAEPAPA